MSVLEHVDPDAAATRTAFAFRLIGRLKPGVSFDDARAQVRGIEPRLDEQTPARAEARAVLRLEPMKDYLVAGVRAPLSALMGAVVFVLLIACANVANLSFVHAARRERELSVRAAIGGSPWRIIRQLLAESFLIALVATALGAAMTEAGVRLLAHLSPASVPRGADVSIDGVVLAFALGTMVATAIVFGLAPAIRVATPRVADLLRPSGRIPSVATASRFRNGIVVAEVSLSFVLLIGCGLMVRSFASLVHTDLGFDPEHVLTFELSNRNFRLAEERMAFVNQVRDRLTTVPGVRSVTLARGLPLDGADPSLRWGTERAASNPSAFSQASIRDVLPGYFETMHVALLEGRTFADSDDVVDRGVIIVDDVVASAAFKDTSAIGRRLLVRLRAGSDDGFTIIGVVHHQRQTAIIGPERGVIYFPWIVNTGQGGRWAVRTAGDAASAAGGVREAIANVQVDYRSNMRAIAPGSTRLIVNDLQPMTTFVDAAMAPTRFALTLIALFASIAAVLAAIGLYSVLSGTVRQRTAEIGVRIALGADTANIASLVVREGLVLTGMGLGAGFVLAIFATRMMTSLLVNVQPTDPATFAVMSVVFLTVAAIACWLPARRAARLDPVIALRAGGA